MIPCSLTNMLLFATFMKKARDNGVSLLPKRRCRFNVINDSIITSGKQERI